MLDIFSATCLLVSWVLFGIQHKPWSLYVYVAFPVYFWREAVSRCGGSLGILMNARVVPSTLLKRTFGAFVAVGALQSMVVRNPVFLLVCNQTELLNA